MTSVDRLEANLQVVSKLFEQACSEGSELVVFPENTLFFRIRSGSKVESFDENGLDAQALKAKVDRAGVALMLTTAVQGEAGKLRNSTILFEPGQEPKAVYTKIHLFDVDVQGANPVRESEVFEHGSKPSQIQFRGWKIGLSICYDVRFAELYRSYAQDVDLILVPSAFLVPTGQAHWHTLLRARAIETQAFVAAPAQVGEHSSAGETRLTFGHSLVIDPWGRVLTDMESSVGIKTLELSREAIEKVRRQIPMKAHRRLGQV